MKCHWHHGTLLHNDWRTLFTLIVAVKQRYMSLTTKNPEKIPPWDVKSLFDPVARQFGDPSKADTRKRFGVACARYQNDYPYLTYPPYGPITQSQIDQALQAEKKGVMDMHGQSKRYKTIKVLKLLTITLLLTAIVVTGIVGNTKGSRDVELAANVTEIIVFLLLGSILIAYFYPRHFYPIYSKSDYTFAFLAGILIIVTAILKIKPTIDAFHDTGDDDDTDNGV